MIEVAKRAEEFLMLILATEGVPDQIKNYISEQLDPGRNATAREVSLRQAIDAVRDSGRPLNIRRQALDVIIAFAKGET